MWSLGRGRSLFALVVVAIVLLTTEAAPGSGRRRGRARARRAASIEMTAANASSSYHENLVESVKAHMVNGGSIPASVLVDLPYSSLALIAPMNIAGAAETAALIGQRQDSIPVVRRLAEAMRAFAKTEELQSAFMESINRASLDLNQDATEAVAEVVSKMGGLKIAVDKAPGIVIEMPKSFITEQSAFKLQTNLILEKFRHASLWSMVDVGTRINWYDKFRSSMDIADFFSPSNADAGYLALLVGASLKELSQVEDQSRIEALLENGHRLYSPLQVQFLSSKFEWKADRPSMVKLREKVRPYLSTEEINEDFDSNELPSSDLPWTLMMRIASIAGKLSSLPPLDKYLAVSLTATQLEEYLNVRHDLTISGLNGISSGLLTNGQAAAILERQLWTSDSFTSVQVEGSLVVGIPSPDYLHLGSVDAAFFNSVLRRFSRLLPSHHLATFMLILKSGAEKGATVNRTRLHMLADYVEDTPDLLKFVSPQEFKELQGADDKIVSDKFLQSTRAMDLPHAWKLAILETNRTTDFTFEDLKAHHKLNILTALTCHELNNFRLLDAHLVLSKYNQFIKSNAWQVFPRALIKCFKTKIDELLNLLSQRDSAIKEPVRYMEVDLAKAVGGHVLSTLDIGSMKLLVQDEVLSLIGEMPMSQIITVMTMKKYLALSELANNVLINEAAVTQRTKLEVGTLSFAAAKIINGAGDVGHFVRVHMRGEFRLVCLAKQYREKWSKLLSRAYGPIREWDEQTLYEIGDFLVVLSKKDMEEIPSRSLRKAVPYLLKEMMLLNKYDSSPMHSNSTVFTKVCANWLGDDGQSYLESVDNLLRLYARASQLGVYVALEPSMNLGKLRRRKRQAPVRTLETEAAAAVSVTTTAIADEAEADNATMFFYQATSDILVQMYNLEILTGEKRAAVAEAILSVKRDVAAYVQAKLNLTVMPDPTKLEIELALLAETESVPAGSQIEQDIAKQLDNSGKEMTLKVAKIIELRPSDINVTVEVFCKFFDTICDDPNFNGDTSVIFGNLSPRSDKAEAPLVDPPLPIFFTCFGLRAAGVSAVSVKLADLEKWTGEELKDCLETIGAVDWPIKTRSQVWQLLKKEVPSLFNSRDKIVPRYSLLLNRLLPAVILDNPMQLNLSALNVDVLSSIGRNPLPVDVVDNLANQIKEDTFVDYRPSALESATEMSTFLFGSMGHLVCGFLDEDLTKVLSTEVAARFLLPVFGAQLMQCQSPAVLGVMAKRAADVYGHTTTWSPSLIESLGVVVAGLSPVDFGTLTGSQLSSLRPEAIAHLSQDHVAEMKIEMIKHLRPEGVSRIGVEQIGELSVGHLEALKLLADERSAVHGMISVVEELKRHDDHLRTDTIDDHMPKDEEAVIVEGEAAEVATPENGSGSRYSPAGIVAVAVCILMGLYAL